MKKLNLSIWHIVLLVVVAVVLTAGVVYMKVESRMQSIERRLMSPIIKISDTSLYKKDNDVFVGTGKCGNKEFETLLDKANSGEKKSQIIDGIKIVMTPNYSNWTSEKFKAFGKDKTAICEFGYVPLDIYGGDLLWVGVPLCSSGYKPNLEDIDEENRSRYEEFFQCLRTEQEMQYFFGW